MRLAHMSDALHQRCAVKYLWLGCRYAREAHIQLLLGVPGVGKSTLLKNLARLILERLEEAKEWLKRHRGFRDCLDSCLDTATPYVFGMVWFSHGSLVEEVFLQCIVLMYVKSMQHAAL